jgi:TRAP-type C4-dicarboxylate transport system substrate-binding protein
VSLAATILDHRQGDGGWPDETGRHGAASRPDHDEGAGRSGLMGVTLGLCRRWGIGFAAAVLGAVVLTDGALAQNNQLVPIRALTTADARQGTAQAVERLATELGETTQGRARIEIDHAAADATAVIDTLRRGEATLGMVRVAEIAELTPELALLTVPFMFRDQQKALSLLESTWLGPLLNDQLRKHGLEPLGFLNAGALRFAGQALPTLGQAPAQAQPIAARPGELRAAAFKALGFDPVQAPPAAGQPPAPLAELRADDLAAAAMGQPPAQVMETSHAYDLVVLVANRQLFADLPLDVRETMRNRVEEVASWQLGAVSQTEELAMAGLRQRGIQLVALPEEQARQAHELVKPAVLAALRNADEAIVRTLLAYAD